MHNCFDSPGECVSAICAGFTTNLKATTPDLRPRSRTLETAKTLENCHGNSQPTTLNNDTTFLECVTFVDCARSLKFVEGFAEVWYVWRVLGNVRYDSEVEFR